MSTAYERCYLLHPVFRQKAFRSKSMKTGFMIFFFNLIMTRCVDSLDYIDSKSCSDEWMSSLKFCYKNYEDSISTYFDHTS